MFHQRVSRLPFAGLLVAGVILSLLVAGCGTEGDAGSSDRDEPGGAAATGLQRVTPSDRIYTIEDLTGAGLKILHQYDVAELPEALDARHLSFKPEGKYLEYEARFYSSHDDAVTHGTEWAEAGAGETAC